MNWLGRMIAAALCLTVAACATTAMNQRYTWIGDIPASCPITINLAAGAARVALPITPLEVVRIASEKRLVKCNSIFQQVVYADEENYYIIKPAFGTMSYWRKAVVVSGTSGKVSVQN